MRGETMSDLLYLGFTVLFFAITYGLVTVCERLGEGPK